MDANIKKCCPSCGQFYNIKPLDSKSSANIPLFIFCGHSMCETCVTNFVKYAAPIECRVCHQEKQISPQDLELFMKNKIPLYKLFPINMYMVGELALQSIKATNHNENNIDNDCYININELIKSIKVKNGECVQCHKTTSLMCGQCQIIVCKVCFDKSHKSFAIFQTHALRAIVPENKHTNNCNSHPNKQLDYYCKDCSKPVCISCFVLVSDESCQGHSIVSVHDVNRNILNELSEILPKVDEVFLRLTKTAFDIGNSLRKLSDETNTTAYSTMMNIIDAHFSKAICSIQQQKDDITQQILKMKITKIDSLKKVKNDVAENIVKAKTILNSIESLEPDHLEEIDLTSLLKEAEAVVKFPWYLKQLDSNQSVDVIIKEDAYTSLNDYIKIEGQENSEFRLINTEELTSANENIPLPPTSIVYPPELVKEKKKSRMPLFFKEMPQLRSKKRSSTSFNSSDSSHKSFHFHDNRSEEEPLNASFKTQQTKPFREGSKELVFISHIVNPHDFYVYRANQMSRLEELKGEFKNAAFYACPPEEYITEGKICLVYNKVDNLWQRCRIVSINRTDANETIYYVFCLDFGISVAVKIDSLRYIPPARIRSPPPLAINCSLADCEPILGCWKKDDTVLMQNIIDNKPALIHIKLVNYMSSGSVRLECDITTFEDDISVKHALAFHDRARISDEMPCRNWLRDREKPKLFIGNSDYQKNSIEEVVITHIVNPDSFYVRKLYLQPIYEKLCEELENVYSLSVKTGTIYLPEPSLACIANIEECGLGAKWARAVVLELMGHGRVLVLLADIGGVVQLHWSALRRMHNKYTVQHGYAYECHLAGVTPLDKKWSPRSVELLQSFQYKTLNMRVEDNSNSKSLGVTLYHKNDERNVICINEEMIKNKFAFCIGLFIFNKNTADELVLTNKPGSEKQLPEAEPKEQVTILKNQPKKSQKPNDEDLEAKDKGPLRLEAKILNYQSPSLMFVSLLHQQEVFKKLFEDINEYYSNNITQGKTNWKVGDRCCTIYNQSQTWRRAVILELENENAKVFYSDYACDETVPVLSLREINQELASIGDAAIMCHLHGVIPATGDEWPSVTKEFLKELLDVYDRVFITKVSKIEGKSMPIELWVYHTIEGGALEANTSDWRCLNHKIIEQGLAIPKQEIEKEKTTDNGRDEELSFLNITGSVQDCLQSESLSLKSLTIESNGSSSTPVEIDTSHEESQNSNVVIVSDWIPPEPLAANEFTAMPTHVNNDGVIYLHDITQQDMLELIGKALDVRFSQPDQKAKLEKWTVGEPCIALFFLDNRFYRGRVLEVNNNTSTCLIHYIDYGNEELVAFENLRKSIVLHQIPTQAHKCILNRIRPVNDQWETKYLDYLHKSLVEKHCYVKITGSSIDDLIPIEIKYKNLCFNDHLVDLNMALYTDGAKVIQKYAPTLNETQELEQSMESHFSPDHNVQYDEVATGPTTSSRLTMFEGEIHYNNILTTDSLFTKAKFKCRIDVLNELEKLELVIIQDDEETEAYENMLNELQSDIENMPPLTGTYENKACVALFSEDNKWYRASILEYSEARNLIKVKYIDYGNIEILNVADVREITEKYAKLPPTTITVTLHGFTVNPDIEKYEVIEKYKEIFLDQAPFVAEVIDDSNIIPSVELRNDDGELIYQSLIEQNILIKCD